MSMLLKSAEEESLLIQECAHRRTGHVSVNYKDTILIWGGYYSKPNGDSQYCPPDVVSCEY